MSVPLLQTKGDCAQLILDFFLCGVTRRIFFSPVIVADRSTKISKTTHLVGLLQYTCITHYW